MSFNHKKNNYWRTTCQTKATKEIYIKISIFGLFFKVIYKVVSIVMSSLLIDENLMKSLKIFGSEAKFNT